MTNKNANLQDDANIAYHSGDFRRAGDLFKKLFIDSPDSISIMAGLVISLIRSNKFDEARLLLSKIDDSKVLASDSLSRFRIIYSKIRLYQEQKLISEGSAYLDSWNLKVDAKLSPIFGMEKAAFLFLDNNISEGRVLLLKSYKELSPELLDETIGRMIFLFASINERVMALHLAVNDFKHHPSFIKFLRILFLGVLGNPFYLIILSSFWMLLWYLIPITNLSVAIIILCTVFLGILPFIFSFAKNPRGSYPIVVFWAFALFMFFLKSWPIYIKVSALAGYMIGHLLLLLIYKSLFRYEGKIRPNE